MYDLTLVTQPGSRLTKQQSIDGTWEPAATVFHAQAETISVTLTELAKFLDEIQHDQALMLGNSEHSPCRLITRDAEHKGEDGITRTSDNFKFLKQPSLMLLDIDYKQWPYDEIDPIAVLTGLFGEFGYVQRSSTTSNICGPDGCTLEASNGSHIYVVVKDGSSIPETLQIIHQRLLLAGYGFVFITKAGTAAVRTFVDTAVGSPERIIYEANPVLLPAHKQARRTYHSAGPELSVQQFTADELSSVEAIELQLLEAAQPRVDVARERWQKEKGLTGIEANEILSTRVLPAHFELFHNDMSTLLVQEVWEKPEKYQGESIRDPLEPGYGKSKAKIFINRSTDGTIESAVINSMAHGGATYTLKAPLQLLFRDVNQLSVNALKKYSLLGKSAELKRTLKESKFIIGQLALVGQYTTIYGPPNSGKTLIILREVVNAIQSHNITPDHLFYINADDNHSGLITKLDIAEKSGFHMLAPGHADFKTTDFLAALEKMYGVAHETVIILDTLKKFTDLMDKKESSSFNSKIRSFVSRGGTVVALAHVNKRKDENGKNIHAGTTDVKDDCDCVYVADVVDGLNETKTVEFSNIKSRGPSPENIVYQYDKKIGAAYSDLLASVRVVDEDSLQTAKRLSIEAQSLKDNFDVIEAIKQVITEGFVHKTAITHQVAERTSVGRQKIAKILELHSGNGENNFWQCSLGDKNGHLFRLNSGYNFMGEGLEN